MINVSKIIKRPFVAQKTPITVTRTTGAFTDSGDFETTSETFTVKGSIQPLNSKDLQQVPEGDRVTGMIKIYTTEQLHTTILDDSVDGIDGMLSDEVTWKGEQYKILNIPSDFSDYGYYKSIAARKKGA